MKIRKFYESEQLDISEERVGEIILDLNSILVSFNDNREILESISNELDRYKSNSRKSNDQIDDSILNLDISKSKLDDSIIQINNIINNLKNYQQNGRKYLYSN